MTPPKSNESDYTIEPTPREIRPTPREEELPELAVRILSDFARIVAAEARLIESNLVDAAQTLLDRVYVAATLIVLVAIGIIAIMASVALLLHHWMPWWQVMGLLGLCAIIAAEILRHSLIPRPTSQASRPTADSQP